MKKILFFALLISFQCKTAQNNESMAHLENTYWKLADINGMPVETPDGSKEVHFVLSSEGGEKRIKGFAGCNSLGGNYTQDGNKIKFTTITTKMACDRLDVENFLTKTLDSADNYKINGETLELYEGNTLLATFHSVYLK
ncbi:META domain-containing protein [Ohtaekwangia sp.]|uniref:META domain-containing protein n=1 Tax=Ohtaekwangia sp. TaxID=2066019 RepID=UPI002F937982